MFEIMKIRFWSQTCTYLRTMAPKR